MGTYFCRPSSGWVSRNFFFLKEDSGTLPVAILTAALSLSPLKMFNKLPDTVAMSEPWGLYYTHLQYRRGGISEEDYPRMVRAVLRLQFKPFKKVRKQRPGSRRNCWRNCTLLSSFCESVFPEKLQEDGHQVYLHSADVRGHQGAAAQHQGPLQHEAPQEVRHLLVQGVPSEEVDKSVHHLERAEHSGSLKTWGKCVEIWE